MLFNDRPVRPLGQAETNFPQKTHILIGDTLLLNKHLSPIDQ